MLWEQGEYRVSTDPNELSIETIQRFLADSYWANDRPRSTIEKAIQHSLCYGVYHKDRMVGFARVVTDESTFFWLCDVYIDPQYRGNNLGKYLIYCVLDTPQLQGLRGMLATRDAHHLYARFGFHTPRYPGDFMVRPPDSPSVHPPVIGELNS